MIYFIIKIILLELVFALNHHCFPRHTYIWRDRSSIGMNKTKEDPATGSARSTDRSYVFSRVNYIELE